MPSFDTTSSSSSSSSLPPFHDSGSQSSFSDDRKPNSPRLGTNSIDPAEYVLPGATPTSYSLYAVARAQIYYSPQTSRHGRAPSLGLSKQPWSSKDKNNNKESQWIDSRLKGTLVFGRDKRSATSQSVTTEEIVGTSHREEENVGGEWWFQLVDEEAIKVVWKFKIPWGSSAEFGYKLSRPLFHVFQGSSRKYGFLFDDDTASVIFLREVVSWATTSVVDMASSQVTRKDLHHKFRLDKILFRKRV